METRPVLLENKALVIFAATGAIGRQVACTCAFEGARVFASGRRRDALENPARVAALLVSHRASCGLVIDSPPISFGGTHVGSPPPRTS